MRYIEVNDNILKKKIIFEALKRCKNLEGDIIRYNGKTYYIHILDNILARQAKEKQ